MSNGPPYPRYAAGFTPGSNGIGQFQIGVSPIGILAAYDPWVPIISQYKNSPRLYQMMLAFNAAMDQTENLEDLYDMIWNVQTAVGYGLDVWGRIVQIGRTLKLPGAVTYFGNEEANSWTGFGQGGFFTGGSVSSNFALSDPDFRTLILAKAATNICDGSIPAINKILLALFKNRGDAFVADNQNMSMTYMFKFPLNPVELAIVETSGALPEPAGIVIDISQT